MAWYQKMSLVGMLMCSVWFTAQSGFASDMQSAPTTQAALKEQIAQSEQSLADLELLVQQCGNCSEEVRISGSLNELRGYIAFLKVRLDSIKSEITLKEQLAAVEKAKKESEKLEAEKAAKEAEALAAKKAEEVKPAPSEAVSQPATASPQQMTLAEIENAYFELDRKIQLFKLQSQLDPSTVADQQTFENRIDEMYHTLIEIRNRMNESGSGNLVISTPGVDDVTLVASRSGAFAPKPKEAPAEVAAAPAAPAPTQAPAKNFSASDLNFKFEGQGFFAYRHDASEVDGQTNDFEMLRMNFGIKYFASDDLTLRYLTDISRESATGKIDATAKFAYVDWKVQKHLNLLLGLQGTNNWVPTETAWGYRTIMFSPMEAFGDYWGTWNKKYTTYLEAWSQEDPSKASLFTNQTQASRSRMGAAADMGAALQYKPVKSAYVNFMIRNGTGFKKAEDDMYKNFQLLVGKYFMNNALHVSAFTEVEPWRGVDENGDSKGFNNVGWDVTASYTQKDKYVVGLDLNSKTFASTESITGTCFSMFAHGFIRPGKLKALGRYDIYTTGFNDAPVKPGDDSFKSNGNRLMLGIDYLAHKNVSIIPNFQMISYEDSNLKPIKGGYVHMQFKW